MVEETIIALATSGATAVVAVMATDAWHSARGRIARLFHGDAGELASSAAAQLDADQALIARAGDDADEARQDLLPAWRRRLLILLEDHPEKEDELRTLIRELENSLGSDQRTWVQNITAHNHGIAFGAQAGDIHFHAAPSTHHGEQ